MNRPVRDAIQNDSQLCFCIFHWVSCLPVVSNTSKRPCFSLLFSLLFILWSRMRWMKGHSSDLVAWEVVHSSGRRGCQMINGFPTKRQWMQQYLCPGIHVGFGFVLCTSSTSTSSTWIAIKYFCVHFFLGEKITALCVSNL